MIDIWYDMRQLPYPWRWRVHLPNGDIAIGVGIPNCFETPREAVNKAKDYINYKYGVTL